MHIWYGFRKAARCQLPLSISSGLGMARKYTSRSYAFKLLPHAGLNLALHRGILSFVGLFFKSVGEGLFGWNNIVLTGSRQQCKYQFAYSVRTETCIAARQRARGLARLHTCLQQYIPQRQASATQKPPLFGVSSIANIAGVEVD